MPNIPIKGRKEKFKKQKKKERKKAKYTLCSHCTQLPQQPPVGKERQDQSTSSEEAYNSRGHPNSLDKGDKSVLGRKSSSLHYRSDIDCIMRCFLAHATRNTSHLHVTK